MSDRITRRDIYRRHILVLCFWQENATAETSHPKITAMTFGAASVSTGEDGGVIVQTCLKP